LSSSFIREVGEMKERCEELEKKLTFTAAFVCVGKNKYKTDFLFFFQKKRFS
jgi:hypothetical protein